MQSQREHMMAGHKNYYLVMGVHPSASAKEIRNSFKKLALKWHPDRHGQFQKSFAHRRFIDLMEAYEVLGNPMRRTRYDDYRKSSRRFSRPSARDGSVNPVQPFQRPQTVDAIVEISRKFEKELQQWCKKANKRARNLAKKSYLQFAVSVDVFARLVLQGVYQTLDIIAGKAQDKKAINDYLKRIEAAPDDDKAHFGIGFLLHQNGDLDEAAAYYLKSLRRNPRNADVLCNLGRLREEQGRYHRAIRCYRRAVELNPDLHVVHACLGILCLRMKQYDRAKECLDFLIDVGRSDLSVQIERAFLSQRS